MMEFLRNIFTAPQFDNEEQTQQARTLHRVLVGAWAAPVALLVSIIFSPQNRLLTTPILIVAVFMLVIIGVVAKIKYTQIASILFVITLLILGGYLNYFAAGDVRSTIIFLTWMSIVGGLLLGANAALIIAAFFSIEQIVLALLATSELITPQT